MPSLKLSREALRFLQKIPAKHARQIAERIRAFQADPESIASEDLKGFTPFRRIKSGEYRIIFFVAEDTLHIALIGKRNDDDIYKHMKRLKR